MPPLIATLNSFIEDTCVIIVAAYLLGRGDTLSSLFRARNSRREAVRLGLLLGLIGLTEIVFPRARYPFIASTLAVVYGASVGGFTVGLPAAALISLGSFASQPLVVAVETSVLLVASVALTSVLRRSVRALGDTLGRAVLGSMAQAIVVFLEGVVTLRWHVLAAPLGDIYSIPANAFAFTILQLVLNDAWERRQSHLNRLEAERARGMVTQAQLIALRARVNPHFLYNTLSSIAALCRIAPDKAETAVISLGSLMRGALETSNVNALPLKRELDNVRTYLSIEGLRLGERLRTQWRIDGDADAASLPPFTVQVLVENAIKHGISRMIEPGILCIDARLRPGWVLVGVRDNGVGMDSSRRRQALAPPGEAAHGMQLLSQQLVLMYGRRARLRLFSREDAGTMVAFRVPFDAPRPSAESRPEPERTEAMA